MGEVPTRREDERCRPARATLGVCHNLRMRDGVEQAREGRQLAGDGDDSVRIGYRRADGVDDKERRGTRHCERK